MRIGCTLSPDLITQIDQRTRYSSSRDDRMRAALARAAVIMRQAFAENFAVGGRPEKWAPLAASTMAQKMMLYHEGVIRGRNVRGRLVNRRYKNQPNAPGSLFTLIRTGALRDSVVRRGSTGNITRINAADGSVEVGTNIPYGVYHMTGTRRMPARPFLELTGDDLDAIMTEISNLLLQQESVPVGSGDVGGG